MLKLSLDKGNFFFNDGRSLEITLSVPLRDCRRILSDPPFKKWHVRFTTETSKQKHQSKLSEFTTFLKEKQ